MTKSFHHPHHSNRKHKKQHRNPMKKILTTLLAVISIHQAALAADIQFQYEKVTGIGQEAGVCRRDPSDIIKVGAKYYVWYSRLTKGVPLYPEGYHATVWYAVSDDAGHSWVEKGESLGKGQPGSFDSTSVFTPNILAWHGKYYLYYTAVGDGFVNKGDADSERTVFGLATADSPDGPWTKLTKPIWESSRDPKKFDSFRIDDACLRVADGKVWLYYKGRQFHGKPGITEMGAAVADRPEGPYRRLNDGNSLQTGGHEVQIWEQDNGVYSMVSPQPPRGNTLRFAADGLDFNSRIIATFKPNPPLAPGMYRPELTGDKVESRQRWGIAMATYGGDPYLTRYEFPLPQPGDVAARPPELKTNPAVESFFTLRDGLANCEAKFENEKTGRVAFLGGSITFNPGWRNGVMAYLQKRFPDTRFDFIAAGIPSVGSNGHAFRLQRDILMRGPVDLLFIESAVNDVSNIPDKPQIILRATEGIVRHIRKNNPRTDIVQMHFAAPELLASWDAGEMPPTTATYEKVAAHYGCVSLDIAREVAARIRAREFTWQSGFNANVHPPPFGQRLYLAAMTRMLDAAFAQTADSKPHPLPDKMIDPASYGNGRFGKLEDIKFGKGFELDPKWKPAKGGTAGGFVNVPAIVAAAPGSEFTCDFDGTAFGLFLAAGHDTCVLEYSLDGAPFQKFDTYTKWSGHLHLPWPVILADGLKPGKHAITVRTTDQANNRTALHVIHVLLN